MGSNPIIGSIISQSQQPTWRFLPGGFFSTQAVWLH